MIEPAAGSPRYPSADAIARIALDRQSKLLDQADAVDTKASTLIGLIGVLLGLMLSSDFVLQRWNVLLSAGAILLIAAVALLAFGVYFPRRYLLNPDIQVLTQKFLARPEEATNRAVSESVARAVPQIQHVVSFKSSCVGIATATVVVALGMIGSRLIYSIEQSPVTAKTGATHRAQRGH